MLAQSSDTSQMLKILFEWQDLEQQQYDSQALVLYLRDHSYHGHYQELLILAQLHSSHNAYKQGIDR